MKSNSCLERLNYLYTLIGRNTDENMPNIRVYANAIEKLYLYFTYVKAQMTVDSMSQDTIDSYCIMFDIPLDLPADEKRQLVSRRFANQYEPFDIGAFRNKLSEFGQNLDFESLPFGIKIKGLNPENAAEIRTVMKLFAGCISPMVFLTADGDGLTFDEWDALDMNFAELDDMRCMFSLIEKL